MTARFLYQKMRPWMAGAREARQIAARPLHMRS
jgi:hypothetical protein